MDALMLTWVAFLALCVLMPIYWYVVHEYYGAWRSGDPIRYFGPTVALLASVAFGASIVWLLSLLVLIGRLEARTIVPPGVGLLVIVLAIFAPALPMLLLLKTLRERRT